MLAKSNPGDGDAGAVDCRGALEASSSTEAKSKFQETPRVKRRPDPGIAACIQLLAETFPQCFAIHEARRRPLKIGIHEDLIAALVGAITPAELGRALCTYTRNKVYRSRLRAGAIRIDLNGEPAGIVTPEQASAS